MKNIVKYILPIGIIPISIIGFTLFIAVNIINVFITSSKQIIYKLNL